MKKPLKPSGPPSPASGPAPPVAAWPIPQPGDVLSYSYLWSHEAEAGHEEGLKDRPVAVVVTAETKDGRVRLHVVPITHSQPLPTQRAIELPKTVKRELGLDDEPSWIILSEMNRFTWPGPDIRIVSGRTDPYHGAIPDSLFLKLRDAILARGGAVHMRTIKRTE